MHVWTLAHHICVLEIVVGALKIKDDPILSTNADGDIAWYQNFIDYHPVSRFNQVDGVERTTEEGGTHHIPAVHGLRPPALIERFDWALCGAAFEHYRGDDPHTIWAEASTANLQWILSTAEKKFNRSRADRVLVFGDSDAWLSEVFGNIPAFMYLTSRTTTDSLAIAAYKLTRVLKYNDIEITIARLQKFFSRIFYEAKDMKVDGIRTMPIGLTEWFLRNGVAETAAAAIANARIDDKPGLIKGAFSFYHDLEKCGRGWGEAARTRQEARTWSKSNAAQNVGVDSNLTEAKDWWQTISKYRFLMAPTGCGVQTPKQIEALSVLTIPIMRRGPYPAWDDLVGYGFPIVVVDEWDEITPAKLDEWWKTLSPRLMSFRDNCLTTEGYWRLFTGQTEFCT